MWFSKDDVHWSGNMDAVSSIELIDITGAIIKTIKGVDLYQYTVGMADVAPGVYVARANYSHSKQNPTVLKVLNH